MHNFARESSTSPDEVLRKIRNGEVFATLSRPPVE